MTAHAARIALATQLVATLARAEPAGPAGPAGAAEARALDHLDRGVAAYRAGDFRGAEAELRAASELAPDRPNPYRWLALTEAALGDCPSALIHVEAFLSRAPAGDPRIAELAALRERCLHTGLVSVSSTPGGAQVRIDGGPPIGATPLRHLAMRTGAHRLAIEKPGYVTETHDLAVVASGEISASFDLRPVSDAPSLVHRWWFWTALGAVALGAAGLGYELTRSSPSRLPRITCDPTGCHP